MNLRYHANLTHLDIVERMQDGLTRAEAIQSLCDEIRIKGKLPKCIAIQPHIIKSPRRKSDALDKIAELSIAADFYGEI